VGVTNALDKTHFSRDLYGFTCYDLLLLFLQLNHDREWLSLFIEQGIPIYIYVIRNTNERYASFEACTVGGLDCRWFAKTSFSIVPDECYMSTLGPNGETVWKQIGLHGNVVP
jgi:hypothetical protein